MKHDTKMFITIQKKISNLQIISTYYRVVQTQHCIMWSLDARKLSEHK